MKNMNTYILQMEAKDIVNAGAEGYIVKKANKRRYKATLDYSLEAIKLDELFPNKTFYMNEDKQYTDSIISVKFTYSVKNENGKVTMGTKLLRENIYENGFKIHFEGKKNPTEFVRFKRSSGSSRVGKCLFIQKNMYKKMMKWSYMDLIDFTKECGLNLASMEAYIALTTSSIIDTIQIQPQNILLIEDFESTFTDTIMATRIEKIEDKFRLVTKKEDDVEITNTIWDGQSLIDSSLMSEKYADRGCLLLRNRFFKSCCFNTEIQTYFEDNNITEISQLNGQTIATDISQIKLITTKSSIKFIKFSDNIFDYLKQLSSTFGVVKYDKPTHYFKGEYVQCHYQLLNTLQLDEPKCGELLKPSLDYMKALKQDIRVFREHLHIKQQENLKLGEINTTDDFMLTMLKLNDKFEDNDLFVKFRKDTVDSYKKNIQKGHLLTKGNYSTLFSCGYEMLQFSCGLWDKEPLLNIDEVYNTNFAFGDKLLAVRSPHVTMANLWLIKNTYKQEIEDYFNLSDQILYINTMKNNCLERLNSADMDSDSVLLTNSEILVKATEDNYSNFLVPTNKTEPNSSPRFNTWEDKCDLDIKTSVNKIGEIINFSQELNSKLWDMVYHGYAIDSEEVKDIYTDISQLAVMSCIEIDSAKKEFDTKNQFELQMLRKKYNNTVFVSKAGNIVKNETEDTVKMKVRPAFMKFMMNKKYTKSYKFVPVHTSMDYIEEIIKCEYKDIKIIRRDKEGKGFTTFAQMFASGNVIQMKHAKKDQIHLLIQGVYNLKTKTSAIWNSEVLEGSEKYTQTNTLKNNYIEDIKNMTITAETIKKIIKNLDEAQRKMRFEHQNLTDEDREISGIGRKLLTILYAHNKGEFLKIFEEQKQTVNVIRLVDRRENMDNKEIIKIYDLVYTLAS